MEQQCAARLRERQVAEFIEDDEIGMDEPVGELTRFTERLLALELIDEFNG